MTQMEIAQVLAMANEQKKLANQQLKTIRRDAIKEWIYDIVAEAKLAKATDKLQWASADWGKPIVAALCTPVLINGIKPKHGELNLAVITKHIMAAPLTKPIEADPTLDLSGAVTE
jgi:hypothetical protein